MADTRWVYMAWIIIYILRYFAGWNYWFLPILPLFGTQIYKWLAPSYYAGLHQEYALNNMECLGVR